MRGRGLKVVVAAVFVLLALSAPAYASYTANVAADTLTLTGNGASDKVVLRLKNGSPGRLQVDVGANGTVDFEFRRSRFTVIDVNAGGGNDTVLVSDRNGVFTNAESTAIFGGSGKDRITGGAGDEFFAGGPGVDTLAGRNGDDAFVWSAGEGSDKVDGQGGPDLLRVTGSSGGDAFILRAAAARLHVERAAETLNAGTISNVELAPLGGDDTVTIRDTTGTGLGAVSVDLGVLAGGDAAADTVTVEGTSAVDTIAASTVGAQVQVTGSPAAITLSNSEAANDLLVVQGLQSGDILSGGILAASIGLMLDGGDGADTINGGNGADTLSGGAGNDTVDGNSGADTALLQDDDDVFVWDPGDGSDVVEGQDGDDVLRFNGAAGAEIFQASSNGGRLLFTRNLGNIIIDANEVEEIELNALGGVDSVTVNDLSATDVGRVELDLGVAAAGDSASDAVILNATVAADVLSISGSGGSLTAARPALTLAIIRSEPANDTLTVNTLGGADLVGASGLASTSIDLTLNGGSGDDVLVGSAGGDTINGEANNDVIQGQDGNDTLDGGTETDYIDGGPGIDSAANGETVVNVP